ncbi:unnamed protein product, partial [marine sediment metagenome]
TVDDAALSFTPSDAKYVVDWPNEADIASYTALNFAPADPIYYEYLVTEQDGTGDCGHQADETDTYVFTANGDLDGDTQPSPSRSPSARKEIEPKSSLPLRSQPCRLGVKL